MFWSIDSIRTQPIGIGRGPSGKLTHSKAVTLLIFSQWSRFRSEGDFYRLAEQQLIPFFPNLPSRPQLNPQFQHLHGNACDFFQHLVLTLGTDDVLYEALDATAVVVRDAKRRGESWLVGEANIGKSNRLGWYRGLKLLLSSTSEGIIIGFRIPEIGTAKLGLYYPSREKKIITDGQQRMVLLSSVHPREMRCVHGQSRSDVGSLPFGRLLRQLTTNWPIPFDLIENILTAFLAFGLKLQPRLRCITSASGSTEVFLDRIWLSLTY